MLAWLRNAFFSRTTPAAPPRANRPGGAVQLEQLKKIQARFDTARTTDYNARHWKHADALAVDSALTPAVRKILRERARYECQENNSLAKGICLTLANDVIGTGPRLRLMTRSKAVNQAIEQRFAYWAKCVGLAKKLRTMKMSKTVDGEAFALFTNNPRLKCPVQLDIKPLETDQIATPDPTLLYRPNTVDGIEFDENGDPVAYHKLKRHPGLFLWHYVNPFAFDIIPAADMLHIFRADRPGQHRGVSELAPALPFFAMLREFQIATIMAAKSAAKFTAVLQTDGSASQGDGNSWDPQIEPFEMVDIDFDMMTTIPYGWKMNQFKAEQPTTTYEMFRNAIIGEIARCVNMPFNIAACNSSGYNYSSGRLDHQTYFKSIGVERSQWDEDINDRIFEKWLDEALLIPGYLPDDVGSYDEELPHQWHWDGWEHVDPTNEANGQATRLKSGTTHRAREYAEEGLDVDAEDQAAADSFGVTLDEYREALFRTTFPAPSQPADGQASDEAEEDDDTETADDRAAEPAEAA